MKTPEELLARILNHMAERMRTQLILKGGILLRLLNSPRATKDIDFVLVSRESKKILSRKIVDELEKMDRLEVTRVNLNSRGIFLSVRDTATGTEALIEINVVLRTTLPPQPLSTAPLANRYALSGRVVSTMALPEAFANKIAAAIERDAARDLYDLSLLEPMGPFDGQTLRERLARMEIDRSKPKPIRFEQAAGLLSARLGRLDEKRLKVEIGPLIPPENRTGLLTVIRASVLRIIQKMQAFSE